MRARGMRRREGDRRGNRRFFLFGTTDVRIKVAAPEAVRCGGIQRPRQQRARNPKISFFIDGFALFSYH